MKEATGRPLADVELHGQEIPEYSLTALRCSVSTTKACYKEIHPAQNHAAASGCAITLPFCDASRRWDRWLECFGVFYGWKQESL